MAIEVPDTRRSVDLGAGLDPAPGVGRPAGGGFTQRRPVRRRPAAAESAPAEAAAEPVVTEPTAAEAAVAEPVAEPVVAAPALAAATATEQPAEPAARAPVAATAEVEPSTAAPRKRAARKPTAAPRKRVVRRPASEAAPVPAPAPEPAPEPTPEPPPDSAPRPEEPATRSQPSPEVAATEPAAPTSLQAVVIRLGGTRYAIDMDAIAEVGRPPRLTRLPGVPEWVAGVANWRGRVLAVVDMRSLLLAKTSALESSGRVVVLARGGVTVGLLAERVDGVASIDVERVEPALPTLAPSAIGLVTGQLTDADGPIALLDADAVLAMRDRLPRVRRVG